MKNIAILGSTGSIGTQTLDVARKNEDLRVVAVSAGKSVEKLEEQIREFHPLLAAVWDEEAARDLKTRIADTDTKVVSGMEGLLELASMPESEILVTAIVGMIGIRPTMEGIRAGKDIALANKETLVTAGHLIMPMAKKYGVQLVVRSSLNDHEGTIVKEETSVERMLISGVALDRNTARISVIGLKDEPGIAFKLFNLLAKDNINVDVILQSIGRENSKDISFTVSRDDADNAVKILEDNMNRIGGKSISCRKDVAKVSIVGAGMMSNPGVAAKMFEALYNNNINISMISTSEIRVTVLIDERDAERAVNAVHDAFGLEE